MKAWKVTTLAASVGVISWVLFAMIWALVHGSFKVYEPNIYIMVIELVVLTYLVVSNILIIYYSLKHKKRGRAEARPIKESYMIK